MTEERLCVDLVKASLEKARTVTILTHLNPDADTIGTGLGIYNLLSQDKSRRVEIVNASDMLPKFLDFLPNFSKIKAKMNFEESLIIACDCGSIDRLGFDLEGREIINIDHHAGNAHYGTVNVVLSEYASASQVAYDLFKEIMPVTQSAATCFYAALLSDTRYFTTSSVNEKVFSAAKALVSLGADPAKVAYHFTQRKSLASLRVLHKALGRLTLSEEARVATLYVTKDDMAETGATMPDLEGIVDYARSLVTVEIALFAVETEEGVRISLRSKGADVSSIAADFGGGGHKVAAGFTLMQRDLHETIAIILQKIKTSGLLHGKN